MRPIIFLILLITCALPATAQETTTVAFIAGPRSHASGDHEFNAGCLLLADCLNAQDELEIEAFVANSPAWKSDAKTRARIAAADTIVMYSDATMGIAGEWEFFDKLTARGKGLMFMHYAVHPSAAEGEKYYRPWIGGAFETGKSVNPHWLADFTVMPDHEIARGVPEVVESYDEWYYNIVFPEGEGAKKIRRLGTATPTAERLKHINNLWTQAGYDAIGKPTTLMWGIEREDGGRGAGFTGGHYHRNWAIDGFRTAVLNTIVWTAGLTVPEGGVKSKPVTEDQLNANLDDYGKQNPRVLLPNLDEIRALPGASKEKLEAWKGKRPASKRRQPAERKKQDKSAAAGAVGTAPLFASEVIKSSDKDHSVKIDIDLPKNTRSLHLIISDEGDKSHDWANWINPRVLVNGKEVTLDHGAWESAQTGHAQIGKDVSSGGKALMMNGKVHRQGLGVHAPSAIHFALPEGATLPTCGATRRHFRAKEAWPRLSPEGGHSCPPRLLGSF